MEFISHRQAKRPKVYLGQESVSYLLPLVQGFLHLHPHKCSRFSGTHSQIPSLLTPAPSIHLSTFPSSIPTLLLPPPAQVQYMPRPTASMQSTPDHDTSAILTPCTRSRDPRRVSAQCLPLAVHVLAVDMLAAHMISANASLSSAPWRPWLES